VWRAGACAHVLEGHGGAVQCALALPGGDLLTGSNDTTVRLWRGGACVHTLTGHTDTVRCAGLRPRAPARARAAAECPWACNTHMYLRYIVGPRMRCCVHRPLRRCWPLCVDGVCAERRCLKVRRAKRRGLALLPGIGFVSASHDHTLRVWDAGGALLAELVGHTALVYRAAAAAGGLVASASEDCTVRLWTADGACLQTLAHPGACSAARGAGCRRGRPPTSAAPMMTREQPTCHQ
jgi:phospholipase A-2-activating protein